MNRITPLLRFLRALTNEQRVALAEQIGTTRVYLYQLAAQPAPNPRLKLAMDLVAASKPLAAKQMTAPLTLEDLLVGTGDDEFAPGPDAGGD